MAGVNNYWVVIREKGTRRFVAELSADEVVVDPWLITQAVDRYLRNGGEGEASSSVDNSS